MKNRIGSLSLFTILTLAALAATVNAHTFHTSLTRMDYDAKKKIVEITIRVFNHDLLPVLERQNKRRIDLGSTPGVDEMILAYLSNTFVLRDKAGAEQKLNWVGKESDVESTFIYVEVPLETSPDGCSLKNTIFFEAFKEQSNRVRLYAEKQKTDLIFVAGDEFKQIAFKST